MSDLERLRELRDLMEKWASDDDFEAAHGRVDDLLGEALELLAGDNTLVTEIVTAYRKVGKWYA